jgi:hypothetical protein
MFNDTQFMQQYNNYTAAETLHIMNACCEMRPNETADRGAVVTM